MVSAYMYYDVSHIFHCSCSCRTFALLVVIYHEVCLISEYALKLESRYRNPVINKPYNYLKSLIIAVVVIAAVFIMSICHKSVISDFLVPVPSMLQNMRWVLKSIILSWLNYREVLRQGGGQWKHYFRGARRMNSMFFLNLNTAYHSSKHYIV